MVEQRSEDTPQIIESLNHAAEDVQGAFTSSLGRLLVADSAEQARLALFEAMYCMATAAYYQTQLNVVEDAKNPEEMMNDWADINQAIVMVKSPIKDWQAFKFGVLEAGKLIYEDLVAESDDFNLVDAFGLPDGLYAQGIPLLEPTEFAEVERQKKLFNSLLLRKLNLVPDEKSIWEHPRQAEFTFDFELP